MQKETGLPFAEGLDTIIDLPHTISAAIMYSKRIESFGELPHDKRPPRYMWDRPYELSEYLKHVWDKDGDTPQKDNFTIDFDNEE